MVQEVQGRVIVKADDYPRWVVEVIIEHANDLGLETRRFSRNISWDTFVRENPMTTEDRLRLEAALEMGMEAELGGFRKKMIETAG